MFRSRFFTARYWSAKFWDAEPNPADELASEVRLMWARRRFR